MDQPLYFYKFVSFDRKDILKDGLIRFTPIGCFNDPFELEPAITSLSREYIAYLQWMLNEHRKPREATDEDIQYSLERANEIDAFKEKYRQSIGKYGVLSLSSNMKINQLLTVAMPEKEDPKTNILMWSHYGDSHKGFVIEFYPDFIEGITLQKVDYGNERHYLTFEDINDEKFDKIFLRKSEEWAYEQEYRAILPLDRASEIRSKDLHLFKINKSRIRSITFGCAMNNENKKIIENLVAMDPELKHVIYQHAYLSEESFHLQFFGDYHGWTNDPSLGGKMIPLQKKLTVQSSEENYDTSHE